MWIWASKVPNLENIPDNCSSTARFYCYKKKKSVFCFPVPVWIAPTNMEHLLATVFTKQDTEQVESEHLQRWGC